jgi:hypothetical protein
MSFFDDYKKLLGVGTSSQRREISRLAEKYHKEIAPLKALVKKARKENKEIAKMLARRP